MGPSKSIEDEEDDGDDDDEDEDSSEQVSSKDDNDPENEDSNTLFDKVDARDVVTFSSISFCVKHTEDVAFAKRSRRGCSS